jgi:ParB-like chromosome segregation protein Spo0J
MSELSDLAVELWSLDKITPYEKNVKIHSEEQIDSLANSIKKFGWTQPIVVDYEGVIIAGHGRRLAAIKLGYKKVPVVVRTDLSKKEADMLRISDNKVSSTEYDMSGLREEMMRISEGDISIWEGLGFTDHELTFADESKLGEIDDSMFADDILSAVEEQKEKNAESAKKIDDDSTPLAKAFGFTRITVGESRRIRQFMSEIEKQHGKEGAEALMAHLDEMGFASDA